MLDLDTRMEIFGVTVFRDTDDPSAFYYLAGSPHISREDGKALFDLFSYRKGGEASESLAGGFLNMAVDLSLGDLHQKIETRLKSQFNAGATLASVPFTKGTARVIALGETSDETSGGGGSRFIEKILGSGMPSLIGDNRAIFSFSLTEEGAAFFLGVLESGGDARPVGVVYDLVYVGLLPSYDLEITIDFDVCYEYMRNRLTLGTVFFKTDIDSVVEELRKREAIKIKQTARTLELSTPEAVNTRQERIDQLVNELATGTLFQQTLTPGLPKTQGDVITATDPSASYPVPTGATVAAAKHDASTTVSADSKETKSESGSGEASAGTSTAATKDATKESGADAKSGDEASSASGDAKKDEKKDDEKKDEKQKEEEKGEDKEDEKPWNAVEEWNRLGRPQAAYAMKALTQRERRTVTYNLTQTTAQEQRAAPQSFIQFLCDPADLRQNIHSVDLNHPFFRTLNINVNSRDVDYDAAGITQMTVQLRYGTNPDGDGPKDTAEAILRGPEDSKDFRFYVDDALTQTYEYKLIVDYKTGFALGVQEPRTESGWISTEARSLSVRPEWVGRLHTVVLQLPPHIPDDVAEVRLAVSYRNAEAGIDDSLSARLTKDDRSHVVHIRPVSDDETFTISQTVFYTDGTEERLPDVTVPDPASGNADDALVIHLPKANLFEGDIMMQDPLNELRSVLVDTEVKQGSDTVEATTYEIREAYVRTVFSVRLPERDVAPTMRYRERLIHQDGGIEELRWAEAASPNLTVGIPAADVLAFTVHYLAGDLSSLGLSALMLELRYRDPEGDAAYDQDETLLITDDASTHIQEWKVRLPRRNAATYQRRITYLHADGSTTATEFVEDTRKVMIISPTRS